jgi:malate permease and related proteins
VTDHLELPTIICKNWSERRILAKERADDVAAEGTRLVKGSMNFILIAFCLVAGLVLRSTGILGENSHRGINAWILYIAMPAVTLLYVPAIRWSSAMILPIAMPFLVWGGAWITLKLLAPRVSLDKETHAALLLTAGLGNTSFIGFPLTQAYFGEEGLRIAVIFDQITFIAFSTLGVMTALRAAHGPEYRWRAVIRSILRFPPFLVLVVALILPRLANLALLDPLLAKLSATVVPLALFSVGLQMRFPEWKRDLMPLSIGLAYKLLLSPPLVFGAALAFQVKGIIAQTSVFEAAMAPMVTSAILASEYRLNPRISNLMVSSGILLSFPTTALWFLILRAAF